MHSRWSFRDHGRRTRSTGVKFVTVSLISLGLNSLWVWLFTGPLELSPAWPILPMLFVTPAVTFLLNRQWVFR
jgi:putative flippase GtrA